MIMVLLLDDDKDFRRALADNLTDDGITVHQFDRPSQVPPLDSLEQLTMLILDYQMEGENGLDFADRFHRSHPDVPVVMVTAYWSEHLDAEVERRGYLMLRRKPVDYEELARLLPADAYA
ncbi:MAG TPA: response regulator [Candidatus Dormibacteraeota bacterium]|nr:response regulator [Candidatus Dormibacteraeota bacterium]